MITLIVFLFILLAPLSGFAALYTLVHSLFAGVQSTDSFIIFGQWLLSFAAGCVGYLAALAILLLFLKILAAIGELLFK